MSHLDLFITPDLADAPVYPEKNYPNLLLRNVPLDCNTTFQVWSPKANASLLPQEADLLKRDWLRLAVICTKLIWLLGATCCEEEDYLMAKQQKFDDWDEVVDFASRYNFRPNAIDILFSPQNIRPLYNSRTRQPSHWVVEPPCWEIYFLQLQSQGSYYQAEPRSQDLSVLVWTGKPIIKQTPGNSIVKQI